MDGAMVFAAAMIILNIIGIVWLGIKIEHFVLVPLGYIIALIIIGNINITACLVVAIIVAAITLIVLIVKLVLLIVDIGGYANQNAKQDRLLKAIKQNDKEGVEKSIAEGALVNGHYDGIDKFPLQVAVENCDEKMVALLIEKGADVTHYSKNGKPLVTAVKKGDKGTVSLLIEKGAKVNLDYEGRLPLDYTEEEELIALLRSRDAITKKEQDALNIDFVVAVGCHDVEKAKSLISKISNIDAIDNGLIVEMVGERLDGTGGEQVRKSEATPLIYAVWNDDIEMVKLLVENGANTEIRDSHDKTALMYAAMNFGAEHNVEILEFLISKGANVNAMCSDPADNLKYQTALMFATISGDVDGVRALIKNGADVNAKAFQGLESTTALEGAKYCGFKEIEILLRKSGARD